MPPVFTGRSRASARANQMVLLLAVKGKGKVGARVACSGRAG